MFYQNFERLCNLKGISPSAAGMAIGRNKSTASDWKRNGTIPKEGELEALAKVLGCSIADFFKSNEELDVITDRIEYKTMRDEGAANGTIASDGNIAEFIKIYNACSTRQKNQLMNIVFDFEDKVLNAEQDLC